MADDSRCQWFVLVQNDMRGGREAYCTLTAGHHTEHHLDPAEWESPIDIEDADDLLLMNDDATVVHLTRCLVCGFLFVDIDKHVAESVTVPSFFEADVDDDQWLKDGDAYPGASPND